MKLISTITLALFCLPAMAGKPHIKKTTSDPGAVLYIISPTEGQKVNEHFKVQFGLKNMGVAPAGVVKTNTGHHHLLIDSKLVNTNLPIPSSKTHIHFGGGQTEAMVHLPKGPHTLQLLLGDNNHIPHTPVVKSKKITIYVK